MNTKTFEELDEMTADARFRYFSMRGFSHNHCVAAAHGTPARRRAILAAKDFREDYNELTREDYGYREDAEQERRRNL